MARRHDWINIPSGHKCIRCGAERYRRGGGKSQATYSPAHDTKTGKLLKYCKE